MNKNTGKLINKGIAKVPVVMQMEAQECGAACLSMITQYFGKYLPLEQIRSDCSVSRDGSSAAKIAGAALGYGLEAAAFKMTADEILSSGYYPCIIHWEHSHFVVLCGFDKGTVYINDPAQGSITTDFDTFKKSFTGVVIFFEPNDSFVADGKQESLFQYTIKRLLHLKRAVTFSFVTGLIAATVGIISPYFSKYFFDNILASSIPSHTHTFLHLFMIFALVQIIISWINAALSLKLDERMAMNDSSAFMKKLLHMPMEFFDQRGAGDLQTRLRYNESISKEIIKTFIPLMLNSVMLIFYIVTMASYNIVLTFIGLLSVSANIMLVNHLLVKRINVTRVQMRDEGILSSTTVSGIEMIESIKAEAAEDGFLSQWNNIHSNIFENKKKNTYLNSLAILYPAIISSTCHALILMIGIVLIIKRHFTIGSIQAFLALLSAMHSPISSLISASQASQEIRSKIERIEDVMHYKEAFSPSHDGSNSKNDKLSGFVEMKNIVFGYSRLDKPLINDFSLLLRPGSCVAIVGASGSGKSTIAKLLSGLYSPWSGDILFDGISIKDIDHSVLTHSVAVVDQEITLFEDTIANNIRMWNDEITDEEVEKAARDAQIHYDIISRPRGYDSMLLENGIDFSGGQRQRIEIARALAQNPSVIILDEATSALDAKTEYNVVKAITDRGIKCLMIAHRLSTIRDADEIIVMNKGYILEHGTHRQLISHDGLYTQLVANE